MRWSPKSSTPAARPSALAGDVTDEAYAKALVELAVAKFGGLDIAFNNAGIVGEMGPVSGPVAGRLARDASTPT